MQTQRDERRHFHAPTFPSFCWNGLCPLLGSILTRGVVWGSRNVGNPNVSTLSTFEMQFGKKAKVCDTRLCTTGMERMATVRRAFYKDFNIS